MDIIFAWTEGNKDYGVKDMYGTTEVTVRRPRQHTGVTKAFSTATKYFHKKVGCSGELSFSDSTSIGISCAWSYDPTSEPSKTVDYID